MPISKGLDGKTKEDYADASGNTTSFGTPLGHALVVGVEVGHIRVRLGERRVLHRGGKDEQQAKANESEERKRRRAIPHPAVECRCAGRAHDAQTDAQRHASRVVTVMLVIAHHVLGKRRSRHGKIGLRRSGRQVSLNELVQRAVKDLAELEELVHLGVSALGLPLGHRLAAHANQHGKLLLGHVARRAQVLKVIAKAHVRSLVSSVTDDTKFVPYAGGNLPTCGCFLRQPKSARWLLFAGR